MPGVQTFSMINLLNGLQRDDGRADSEGCENSYFDGILLAILIVNARALNA